MNRRSLALVCLPLGAVIAQGAAFALLWFGSNAAYGSDRGLDEWVEGPLTWIVLGLGGVMAGGLAIAGLYRTLRDSRLWVAISVTCVTYVPILFVASVCTYSLLVVWAVV